MNKLNVYLFYEYTIFLWLTESMSEKETREEAKLIKTDLNLIGIKKIDA